jgi:hypothetical protein
MKSRGERWIVSTVVKAKDGSSVVTTGGAPFGHATNSECMSLLLRRWRQWVSPAARRGRRATKGEYAVWVEAQREWHRRGAADVQQKQ